MEKIKYFIESEQGKNILIVLIVILVGLGSFELGRLSKNSENQGVRVEYSNQGADSLKALETASVSSYTGPTSLTPANFITQNPNLNKLTTSTITKNFFASKRGKKYYTSDCSAGKSIKMTNRVYFDTNEQAEKAGYTLSTSCQ